MLCGFHDKRYGAREMEQRIALLASAFGFLIQMVSQSFSIGCVTLTPRLKTSSGRFSPALVPNERGRWCEPGVGILGSRCFGLERCLESCAPPIQFWN